MSAPHGDGALTIFFEPTPRGSGILVAGQARVGAEDPPWTPFCYFRGLLFLLRFALPDSAITECLPWTILV